MVTREFVAAITQLGDSYYDLPDMGGRSGYFIISAIGGGQAGEDGIIDGGVLGYSRGGQGGCFSSFELWKNPGIKLLIHVGAGGASNHIKGEQTTVSIGTATLLNAPGGGMDISAAYGGYIAAGGDLPDAVAYNKVGTKIFLPVGVAGGGGQGGSGAGGPYTKGGSPSDLINAHLTSDAAGIVNSTYSGGGAGGELDDAARTLIESPPAPFAPPIQPSPFAPNNWWAGQGYFSTIPSIGVGYGGGNVPFGTGGKLGTLTDGFNDGQGPAAGGGAGDIQAIFPNATAPFDPDITQPWHGSGGKGAAGKYFNNQYGSGGGGGGGAGSNTDSWNITVAADPGWAINPGPIKGSYGGDGGLFGGGGGGGGSGAPNGGFGNGVGGRGAQGGVFIEFVEVRAPKQPVNAALIPLPDPKYAGNRRLLFWPWWIR